MMTLYPLKYTEYYNYYKTLNFTLNESNLKLNIIGNFVNQNINTNIQINKNALFTSSITLNSLTVMYTYLLIDLYSFTYASNSVSFNSIEPHLPEFLIYFDSNTNFVTSSTQSILYYSNTVVISSTFNPSVTVFNSLTSLYSSTADFAQKSISALYSSTANFAQNSLSAEFSNTAIYSLASKTAYSLAPSVYVKLENLDIIPTMIPKSTINVGTVLPATALEYDSFYKLDTKELFVYLSNTWRRINWQKYITADELYRTGRLRINQSTSALEIVSVNLAWFEIIPTIGNIFLPIGFNYYNYNYNYSYTPYYGYNYSYTPYYGYGYGIPFIYYIAPGQKYLGLSHTIAPIIAVNGMSFRGEYTIVNANEQFLGLYPSGQSINNGYATYNYGNYRCCYETYYYNYWTYYVTVAKLGYSYAYPRGMFSIHIANNKIMTTSVGNLVDEYAGVLTGENDFPTTGFFLGTWCYDGSIAAPTQIMIERVI